MCLQIYKNKVNYAFHNRKTIVFGPCGCCESCRKKSQYSWAWRLTSDFQYVVQNKGYKVGFITLTYNDSMLPRFPTVDTLGNLLSMKFKKDKPHLFSVSEREQLASLENMSCFSRKDTEELLGNIRKHCHRERGLTDIRYFLASERGKNGTNRPHYHLMIAWDGSKYSAEEMHAIIKKYWAEPLYKLRGKKKVLVRGPRGFVCPSTPMGGESKRSGKKIPPFEVGSLTDVLNACFYTAKYVTKDFYFMREITSKVEHSLLQYLKDFLPHHRQSQSLGFNSIENMSDSEKLDLLNKGRVLLGNDRLMLPPMYIQNKILYSNDYVWEIKPHQKPKRLVRRGLSEFYRNNLKTILQKKIDYYDTLFKNMEDVQYWVSTGLDYESADDISWFVRYNRGSIDCSLGTAYVVYFGLRHNYCFNDIFLTFKNRFCHATCEDFVFRAKDYLHTYNKKTRKYEIDDSINKVLALPSNPPMTYSSLLISRSQYDNINYFFNYLMPHMKWQNEEVKDEDVDYVREILNQPLTDEE